MTISKITLAVAIAASALVASPAFAQDEASDSFTITGSVAGITDYRYRGISQTNENFAVQGSININHESGFYVGAWASNVDFTNSSSELDLYAGFTKEFDGITGDVGVYGYIYPDNGSTFNYYEVYASVKGALGPATAKVGVNYAPKQDNTRGSLNEKADNFYLYGDVSAAIPSTPFTLRGHVGRSIGDSTLTLQGDDYWDYNVGIDYTYKNLTFGVTYIDTDLKKSRYGAVAHDNFDSAILASITAAF